MGEEINPKCLSINNDLVFVSYRDGVIRTASKDFYRRFKDSSMVAKLVKPLSAIPTTGQKIRITNWHNGLPVKIEAFIGKHRETIYEIDELPDGLTCLAGCSDAER